MDFIIRNLNISVAELSRKIGYVIIDNNGQNIYNMVRKFSSDNYPRFHIYVTQRGYDYNFSLHLDQKKPVYEGTHAHNGEYFGPIVETEADRVKSLLLTQDKPESKENRGSGWEN